MKKKEYISGFFFLALSVVLFFQSKGLTIRQGRNLGEGFFPLVLSVLLAFLSLMTLLRAWLQAKPTQEVFQLLGPGRRKFFLYFTSLLAYALIFPKVGFSLTLTAFLILILKIAEKQSWKRTLAVTLITVALSNILFIVFLSVPLPEGILTSIIQIPK